MTLDDAIELLCRIHTKDDDLALFTVEMPWPTTEWFDHGDYVQAWEAMRKHRDEQRAKGNAA